MPTVQDFLCCISLALLYYYLVAYDNTSLFSIFKVFFFTSLSRQCSDSAPLVSTRDPAQVAVVHLQKERREMTVSVLCVCIRICRRRFVFEEEC